MIKNNKFFLKELTDIVFIGYSPIFEKMKNFNSSLKINSKIISSSDQSKYIKHEHIIFDEFDNRFIDFVNKNFRIDKTLFISIGARSIFKKRIIKFLNGNLINFHGTRLPLDQGGGGFSWNILREDRISNQLVHLVDENIDTGPIIYNRLSLFPKDCKIPIDFESFYLKGFIVFYKEFIRMVFDCKKFSLIDQPRFIGRYNPRLNTDINGYINWDMDSYDLYNFINAFDDPYLGAKSKINRGDFGSLRLKKVHLHGGDSSNHPFISGIVIRNDLDWIVVATKGKHMLLVEEVLDKDNKNIIDYIKPGDRFYNNYDDLLKARSQRIIYNSKGLKNEN